MKIFRKKSIEQILKSVDEGHSEAERAGLSKHLSVIDLIAFGIAAVVGAGIFSTIGMASAHGGPGVIFLFAFTAIACAFTAFAYAEFASILPVAGSAYTYSYVAFGELVAWIIGWALILEYSVGNITVAVSWSDYFTSLLSSIRVESLSINGIHLPEWMTTDFVTSLRSFNEAVPLLSAGKTFENLSPALQSGYTAWTTAPVIGGLHLIADIPAIVIVFLITWLVYIGIKETRNASNTLVAIKLAIVLLVIAVGAFYIDVSNWNPFLPNGMGGVLRGVSSVFFAYIGFDAISTTAEECKNPQRDLPRGIVGALIICTILYILIALVLTGMVKYDQLAVGDPLAFVFEKLDMRWMSGIIAISAIVAMASVLLVFQMGQPRIWMSMSRDGLLPPLFAKIHPKYHTPSFATIMTGGIVIIPTFFVPSDIILDLCSMGTLFAFSIVCAGVLQLHSRTLPVKPKFRTPYINSKYIVPVLIILSAVLVFNFNKEGLIDFVTNKRQPVEPITLIKNFSPDEINLLRQAISTADALTLDLESHLSGLGENEYSSMLAQLAVDDSKKYISGWKLFQNKIPMWLFILLTVSMAVACFLKNFSLIPVLGLLSCFYMMAQIPVKNWMWFMIWLTGGLVIYFGYSIRKSKLAHSQ